jgi:hypothetical protein
VDVGEAAVGEGVVVGRGVGDGLGVGVGEEEVLLNNGIIGNT